jgi:hypothetical protein
MTLKNICATIRKNVTLSSVLFSLLFSLLSGAPAQALDNRIIDIVSVSWNKSAALPGTVADAQKEIETKVGPLWRDLTTIYGDVDDRRIQFNFGRSLPDPIKLTFPVPCENNFTTWTSAVRVETYKRMGISDWQSRYLVIITPDAGCIWSGRALIGDVNKPGGSLVLHNSVDGFIVAHELGHALGLGHSNLMRCSNGATDASWESCKAVEYGGTIDVMGNVDVTTPLSTYHQWRMGLLKESDIRQSWKSETIEINAVDVYGKPRAIFLRDGRSTYWIEYRRASSHYKSGLVIYRTDPPPAASVLSPNAYDSSQDPTEAIGTDIWMLNLDNYNYANSVSTGSMTLEAGKSTSVYSGNISISISGTTESSASVVISRKDSSALKKPILTSPAQWRAPDVSILDGAYTETVNDIADYEAKIDAKILTLTSSKVSDWKPTYLNPFTPPQVLQLKDLPEGQYSLSIRVRNLSGQWSPWSDVVQANIDRGLPNLGSEFGIAKLQSGKVVVELSGINDSGSGLCTTQLVNPDGWILAKSTLKSKPQFSFTNGENKSGTLQVFDCLGNGRSATLVSQSSFNFATEMKRSGRWTNASSEFPTGSMKCSGKCSAYLATSGTAGLVLGSGTAEFSLVGGTARSVKAAKSGDGYLASSLSIGARKKSVKIAGSSFVLVGIASASVAISGVGPAQAFASAPDKSLDEPIQKTLNGFGFNSGDFSSEWSILPMGRGTTLEDPTLDLCSSTFDSELLRKERRQVVASKTGNPYLFLSTESVRYKSQLAAEQALGEVKASYASCVQNKGGTERDGVFTKYEFLELPNLPANLVAEKQRVVVHAKIGEGEATRYLFGAYQYHKDMFTGLYVVRSGETDFSQEELSRWLVVAGVMAERLKS